jgi:hypothetical protein
MIWLVAAILLVESVRLAITVIENRRIDKVNKSALEHQQKALAFEQQQNQEWKTLRKLELEELKELAQGNQVMNDILKDLKGE